MADHQRLTSNVGQSSERRAWDSNPQPLAGHLNSNQAGSGEKPEEYDGFEKSAAPGAARSAENAVSGGDSDLAESGPITPDLADLIRCWPNLSEATKAAFSALLVAAINENR